jgi:bacteriocin-like protein
MEKNEVKTLSSEELSKVKGGIWVWSETRQEWEWKEK